MLQPTGLFAMERLGLRVDIETIGHRISHLHGLTESGRTIFDLHYDHLSTDSYAVAVHRAALHGVLWDAFLASGARLMLNHDVGSAEDTALTPADFVIDASGARSVLRPFVTSARVRAFRFGAVWASVPDVGIMPGTLAQRYIGARVMLGYLPVGQRALGEPPTAALFWSLRDDQFTTWHDGFDAWRVEARALWPALTPVLDDLSGPEAFTHATYQHFDTKRPWRDKFVLIGDSAHTTSPQLGQGANQALIDAVVLADSLAQGGGPEEVFRRYAKARRVHVRFYQAASWAMTRFFQSDSNVLPVLRDLMFHPMTRIPWLHGQMLHTLAGLKTGIFACRTPADIVNCLVKP